MSENNTTFQPGDILISEWGYDQSNVDYYQIVHRTPHTVTIQQIKKDIRYEPNGVRAYPVKDDFLGEKIRRRIKDGYIEVSQFESAYPFDGKGAYCDIAGWR